MISHRWVGNSCLVLPLAHPSCNRCKSSHAPLLSVSSVTALSSSSILCILATAIGQKAAFHSAALASALLEPYEDPKVTRTRPSPCFLCFPSDQACPALCCCRVIASSSLSTRMASAVDGNTWSCSRPVHAVYIASRAEHKTMKMRNKAKTLRCVRSKLHLRDKGRNGKIQKTLLKKCGSRCSIHLPS